MSFSWALTKTERHGSAVCADREGRFHGDLSGSDKHYSFALPACVENSAVHLCESAIDVMSYATLCKLDGIDWRRHNLLSLAGITSRKRCWRKASCPLPSPVSGGSLIVKTIYLHLDNDGPAGWQRRQSWRSFQRIRGQKPPPPTGKDVNDTLCTGWGFHSVQQRKGA